MNNLEKWLKAAADYHGHLCAGQVLGVRMGLAGLAYHGIDVNDPLKSKRLIIFVETDRCAADALQTVTGCKLGKRTLKHVDYGKMAAVFIDLSTKRAVRVFVPAITRQYAKESFPGEKNPYLKAYKKLPDDKLFRFQEVEVELAPTDLPGKPQRRVLCETCGEEVNDGRDIVDQGKTYCKACFYGTYYKVISESEITFK